MTTLSELCAYLNEEMQSSLYEDFCVNGLQVEGASEIRNIAVAVSASLETITAAVQLGVQALIVHHGIFWKGDSPVIKGPKRKKLELLLNNQISLIAYHLPLDAQREFGNNWKAAKDLGLKNLEPFGGGKQPIGVKGIIDECRRADFQLRLENYYGHQAHCAMGGLDIINSVGLISGGAHRSITEAVSSGLDAFVTGSFDEPVWHIAFEEKINFFALGHANTECIGPRALGDYLEQHLGLSQHFIEMPNPF